MNATSGAHANAGTCASTAGAASRGSMRCYTRAVEVARGKTCLAVRAHQPVVGIGIGG